MTIKVVSLDRQKRLDGYWLNLKTLQTNGQKTYQTLRALMKSRKKKLEQKQKYSISFGIL